MFGKILGAIIGFIFLRSIGGAVIGALAGHFFIDKAVRRSSSGSSQSFFTRGFAFGSNSMFGRQDLFFQVFFNLMGKLAKIDGSISQEEHIYISNLLDNMKLQGPARNMAQQFFNDGQNNPNSYKEATHQFYQITAEQPQLRTQLLYQLVGLASADKVITDSEKKFLQEVASILKISETELNNHIKSFGVEDNQAYHILGVSSSASDEEVKAAYKQALKEYHPDVLKSKGLPPSMLEFAQKRFYDIQNSWEQIRKARSL